jgi:hypothetical protein
MPRRVVFVLLTCSIPGLLTMTPTPAAGQTTPTAEEVAQRVAQYAPVRLTADVAALSAAERAMIPLLIEAAREMDGIFWQQAYGNRQAMQALTDPAIRRFAEINYGPWDRLNANQPFVAGVGPKPDGANFYPADLTKEQFESYVAEHPDQAEALRSLYTMVRRDGDRLRAVPYYEFFAEPTQRAAKKLQQAAALAEDPGLRRYLDLRSAALLSDSYFESDLAWLDMKDNGIDVVIGPIETYEDHLFGYKAAHEAYVLIKDRDWSQRLAHYAALLPDLQRKLPVPEKYKQESPGSNSDLNAYDVVFYAGDCNAGSKTIAINLPNDEQVQLQKGTRRLQLKNAMRAKYERILVPISETQIVAQQQPHITFDAFFGNTMLHEVAHGLGIKNTLQGQSTVREALREVGPPLEECKADILGLFLAGQLRDQGILDEGSLLDNYVTYMAGIFRSVRFGASSAHGRANMISFNYFAERGAFARDSSGAYRVDAEKMRAAIAELAGELLRLQGDGDYAAAAAFLEQYAQVPTALKADLERINRQGIPVDVVFEQGLDVLGLER